MTFFSFVHDAGWDVGLRLRGSGHEHGVRDSRLVIDSSGLLGGAYGGGAYSRCVMLGG